MLNPPNHETIRAYRADFDKMGEDNVRVAVETGQWQLDPIGFGNAKAWLKLKDEERELAASAIRDAREERTLAIAQEALATAKSQSAAAFAQARWAKWAAIVATTALIISNRVEIIAWLLH